MDAGYFVECGDCLANKFGISDTAAFAGNLAPLIVLYTKIIEQVKQVNENAN